MESILPTIKAYVSGILKYPTEQELANGLIYNKPNSGCTIYILLIY